MDTFSERLSKAAISDPLTLQALIHEEFQTRQGGGALIVDPNNTFTFLTEMSSRLTSEVLNRMTMEFDRLYPKRAQTFSDLFRHMSDFDYKGLYAAPSTTNVVVYFDHTDLVEKAKVVLDSVNNTYYKKAVIPEDTVFAMGDYRFGLYYPINIRINAETGNLLVSWDTSVANPLHTVAQGSIEHRMVRYGGLQHPLASINIPVYQFEKAVFREDVTADTGFVKVYPYDDSFYVAKVYYDADGDGVAETLMHSALSDMAYNVDQPTAYITVAPDEKKCRIAIPQVYFNNEQIGSRIRVELYTTKGALDVDIDAIDEGDVQILLPAGNPYTDALHNLTALIATAGSSKIIGGSNGYDFDELKERIVDDSFYGTTPITLAELVNYFEDAGYFIKPYRDGVTDRVYHCYKDMVLQNGLVVGTGGFKTEMNPLLPGGEYADKVTDNGDSSYTIPPDIAYKLNTVTGKMEPVGTLDDTRGEFATPSARVTEFNNNCYGFCPFHTRVHTSTQYPIAYSYMLSHPSLARIEFVNETLHSDMRLSIYQADVTCATRGFQDLGDTPELGMYSIDLVLMRDGIPDDKELCAFAVARAASGQLVGQLQTIPAGATSLTFQMGTYFELNKDDEIVLNGFTNAFEATAAAMPLNLDLSVYFFDPDTGDDLYFENINREVRTLLGHILNTNDDFAYVLENFGIVNHQKMHIELGRRIEELATPVQIDYQASTYDAYGEPEYAKYSEPQYELDSNGAPVWSSSDITEWTFPAETPAFDLQFNEVDNTAIVSMNIGDGTDPSVIELGMAVESPALSDIADLLYITDIVDNGDDTYTLSFNVAPVDTGAVSDVKIGFPEDGLIQLTPLHFEDEWVFPPSVSEYDMTAAVDGDDQKAVTVTEAVYDEIVRYMDSVDSTGTNYTRRSSMWLCVTGTWSGGTERTPVGVRIDAAVAVEGVFYVYFNDDSWIPAEGVIVTAEVGVPQLKNAATDPNTSVALPPRQLRYLVTAPYVDLKLLMGHSADYTNFFSYVNELFASYLTQVAELHSVLLPGTGLAFVPRRTLGPAMLKSGSGGLTTVPLELEMKMVLYVDKQIFTDDALQNSIRDTIIAIIDDHTAMGKFSCAEIAKLALSKLDDSVQHIDIVGVKKVDSTAVDGYTWDGPKTVFNEDPELRPCLKTVLTHMNNLISVDRALTLEFVAV